MRRSGSNPLAFSNILSWFKIRLSCPETGSILETNQLEADDALRSSIMSWKSGCDLTGVANDRGETSNNQPRSKVDILFIDGLECFSRQFYLSAPIKELYELQYRRMHGPRIDFELTFEGAILPISENPISTLVPSSAEFYVQVKFPALETFANY